MFGTARLLGTTRRLDGVENNQFQEILSMSNNNAQPNTEFGLIVDFPFKIPTSYEYQQENQLTTQQILQQQMDQQRKAYLMLKQRKALGFTVTNTIYSTYNSILFKQQLNHQISHVDENQPLLLQTVRQSASDLLVNQIELAFSLSKDEFEDPVQQACQIVKLLSLTGYNQTYQTNMSEQSIINNQQNNNLNIDQQLTEGLYGYLKIPLQPTLNSNTYLNVLRATCQLLTILYSNPFTHQITTQQFFNEPDYQLNNNQLEVKARKFTLQKFFEHYLLDNVKTQQLSNQIVTNILLNRFSQAAALLQQNNMQKLAIIVASGQKQQFRQLTKEKNARIDVELVSRAMEGDLDALIVKSQQTNLKSAQLFGSWFELFDACLNQSNSIKEAVDKFTKTAFKFQFNYNYESSFLFQILKNYACYQLDKIQLVQIERLVFSAPSLVGFVILQFFKRFPSIVQQNQLQLDKITNRQVNQLICEVQDVRFTKYASQTKLARRVFGLRQFQFLVNRDQTLVNVYLGLKQNQNAFVSEEQIVERIDFRQYLE